MNVGKIFERSFAGSVPKYAKIHRLPDSAQSFGNSSNLRFSQESPFDFILWDSHRRVLFALELKSVKGKSISYEKDKGGKGIIHYHQIEALNEWNKYEGTICGFVIEFRELEATIFLYIDSFNKITKGSSKKSINYEDIVNSGLPYIVIPQTLKRTRYTYDVESLLSKANFIEKEDKENDEGKPQS